jgi:nicotinamide-nucleotide amidase
MLNAAKTLVDLLSARELVCATAESCTGGGVASAITAVPGSSAVFAGGVVSYANEVKHDVLGVKEETLAEFGAVSAETAAQMAAGVRSLMKCDLAVSLTGIAGPGGGSAEKPVGLVWFGLADGRGVRTEKAIFSGERDEVRHKAVIHALGMLTVAAIGGGA